MRSFDAFVGGVVELPITMPQDHTLFVILRAQDAATWLEKIAWIRERGGLAVVLTHPDYVDAAPALPAYEELLTAVAADPDVWRPLPREVAAWWRRRARTDVVVDGNGWGLAGPAADEATITMTRRPQPCPPRKGRPDRPDRAGSGAHDAEHTAWTSPVSATDVGDGAGAGEPGAADVRGRGPAAGGEAGPDAVAGAWRVAATFARTDAKSGCAGFSSGGTNCTLVSGVERALAASPTKRASSPLGRSVLTTRLPAAAMSSKCARTPAGSSWWSIAFITHLCRCMRA